MLQRLLLFADAVVPEAEKLEKGGLSVGWIIAIIVLVVLVGGFIGLSILGKKLQKKQEESEKMMHQGAQLVSIFVIEKGRKKITEAGFPQIVVDQTPKYLRRSKVPVVKAKVGPKIASLMCDEKAFNVIPEKKEVKVLLNGIYIVEAKSARGGLEAPPVKKGLRQKLRDKLDKMRKEEKVQDKKDSGKLRKKVDAAAATDNKSTAQTNNGNKKNKKK